MVSFPYYSHIFRDSYLSGMGIVWETYHKGGPIIGGPWKSNWIHVFIDLQRNLGKSSPSWRLNQPILKHMQPSNFIISQGFGVNIKHVSNHHLVTGDIWNPSWNMWRHSPHQLGVDQIPWGKTFWNLLSPFLPPMWKYHFEATHHLFEKGESSEQNLHFLGLFNLFILIF